MRFHGSEGRRSGSGSRRANLPRGVCPDTEYRDVEIDYAIASRLEEPPEELPALLAGSRDEYDEPPDEGEAGKAAKADAPESDEES